MHRLQKLLFLSFLLLNLDTVLKKSAADDNLKDIEFEEKADAESDLEHLVISSDKMLAQSFLPEKDPFTSCSCYSVANPFIGGQPLCICRNVCTVKTKVFFLNKLVCDDKSEAVAGGPLSYVPCKDESAFKDRVRAIFHETFEYKMNLRPENWLESRKKVTWIPGLSYFQQLKRDATNVAHLLGRIMTVLIANNCTVDAMIPKVDRFVIPRAPAVVERMNSNRHDGFHASLMSLLFGTALAPVLSDQLLTSPQMTGKLLLESQTAAYGRVQFEGAIANATEEQPICYERVVMTGLLRGISFVGGAEASTAFTRVLSKMLDLHPKVATGKVRMVWLQRKNAHHRREFTPPSQEAIAQAMTDLDFELREVNFAKMTFKEQMLHTMEADILFSIHGAGLTIPATFARHNAVVIEIMPYLVDHTIFSMKALTSGITYMKYQCHKGPDQKEDRNFANMTIEECMSVSRDCVEYYLQNRNVDLPSIDFKNIKRLLTIAKEFVLKARASKEEGGTYLKKLYGEECVKLLPVYNCRQSFIQSPLVDLHKTCVLEYECRNV